MKRCTKCGEVKSFDDYHRSTRSPDGRQGWCKVCKSDPVTRRNDNLWSKYRLRPADFDALVIAQNYRCAGCRLPTTDWHVDHDHRCCPSWRSCGACVRGLLCRGCNTALGGVRDDPRSIAGLLTYLNAYASRRAA